VFNVSACVWNQGAQENIITITPAGSESNTVGGGSASSTGSAQLSGGAKAGIAVGSVIAGLALIALCAFIILRKRRKWLKAGYAATSTAPEPDESVLKGPVFNSGPHSSAVGSTPMTADDVSAARSTTEVTRSANDSPPQPVVMGENVELDGRDTLVRPDRELDGKEVMKPGAEAQNPGVYELPGSAVAGGTRSAMAPSSVTPPGRSEVGDGSPRSPFASTLSSTWGQDEHGPADANLVSPTSVRHGPRPF
jgi:hypothetical protein